MLKTSWRALVICSSLTSCSKNITLNTAKPITAIDFHSFRCTDLSEDQTYLSTKDDEIVAIYGILKLDSENKIIEENLRITSVIQVKKNSTFKIENRFNLIDNNKPLIFIGLIELDDMINSTQLLARVKNRIRSNYVINIAKVWQKSVESSSKTNDNLGYILQKPKSGNMTYLIAGSHLTDRYNYSFSLTGY